MGKVVLDIDGHVARLRLDNAAKLNCIDGEMLRQLEGYLQQLELSSEIRICLLQAEPARAFCAGADIGEWSALSARDFSQNWLRQGNRIFDRLAQLPMPTVVLINGPVMGGGLELVACCDCRLIGENSTFSLPETGIGVIPGWSGTQRLSRLLPEAFLKDLLLTGKTASGREVAAVGFGVLVSDMEASAQELVERVVKRSPEANRLAKMMIHAAVGENASAMIDALGGGMAAASSDKEIGVKAFKSRKAPKF